jgi:hypothetical protein
MKAKTYDWTDRLMWLPLSMGAVAVVGLVMMVWV